MEPPTPLGTSIRTFVKGLAVMAAPGSLVLQPVDPVSQVVVAE